MPRREKKKTRSLIRKCRKCGKAFKAEIASVHYCSMNCMSASHNPVAAFNHNRSGVHKPKKGKGSYTRKTRRGTYE